MLLTPWLNMIKQRAQFHRRPLSRRSQQRRNFFHQPDMQLLEDRTLLAAEVQIEINFYEDNGGSVGALITDDMLSVGQNFFVEILAGDFRTAGETPAGLVGLSLDIAWGASFLEEIDSPFNPSNASSPLVTSDFVFGRGGTLDNGAGTIDELAGGSLPAAGLGSAIGVGQLERFSLMHFNAESATSGAETFAVTIGTLSLSLADGANVDDVLIESQTYTIGGGGSMNSAPDLADIDLTETIIQDIPDVNNVGFPVTLLTAGVTDADSGDPMGIAIIGLDESNGTGQYSLDGGATWMDAPSGISESNAFLLPADGDQARVRFVPNAGFNGTITNVMQFRAWDQTTGMAEGFADTSGANNGGSTAFSSATDNVTLIVDAPPTVEQDIADVTVNEDAANTLIDLKAAFDDVEDTDLELTYSVESNTNAGLFSNVTINASGVLILNYAANANGSSNITVRATDSLGQFVEDTFLVTVNPVNDVPSFSILGDQQVSENAGAVSVANFATGISAGPSDEAGQVLTFLVSDDNNALFSSGPAINAMTGELTYTVAAGVTGSAVVTVQLMDDGGTANGGVNLSAEQTFTISVTGINTAPSFTLGAVPAINEDAGPQTVSALATNIDPGGSDESGQMLTFHLTTDNDALFSALPTIDAVTGDLTYTIVSDAVGTANVTVVLMDDGGTADGGVDTSGEQFFTIQVNPVNDAPSFDLGNDQTVDANDGPQSVSGFASNISAGPADEAGQVLNFVVTNDNNALFSSQPAIDLSTGDLTFTTATNAFGSALVTVVLMDDGGTANGGENSTTKMFMITVLPPVNDAPTIDDLDPVVVDEDSGPHQVPLTGIGPGGGPDEAGQTVTVGTTQSGDDIFDSVMVSGTGSTRTLTYTLKQDAFGTATIFVNVMDDGGTANGGVDTTQKSFTVTVNPVNDEPSFVLGNDQTILEDAGPQTVAGFASNIDPGAANESGQGLTFLVTTDNDQLFSVLPSIDPTTGDLTYTTANNAFGSATISVQLMDDGGTTNSGDDTSGVQQFTIQVNPVNDTPVALQGMASGDEGQVVTIDLRTLASDAETPDDNLTFAVSNPSGGTVTLLGDGYTAEFTPTPGFNGTASFSYTATDDDAVPLTSPAATVTIDYSALNSPPNASGTTVNTDEDVAVDVDLRTLVDDAETADDDLIFSVAGASNGSVQLLSDGYTARFTPAMNYNGPASFTYSVTDTGDGNDPAATVGPVTIDVTIDPIDDEPEVEMLSLVAGEDSPVDIDLRLLASDPETADDDLIFSVNNAVGGSVELLPDGYTARFTPNPGFTGTATFDFTANDGTGNESAPALIEINFLPVNDAPSFDIAASSTATEDAGTVLTPNFATNIDPGGVGEAGQVLTFLVSNDNNALFSIQPTISSDGTLSYTTAANAVGSATVSVQLMDDGGTADGGEDTSGVKTFTITLTPVNDEPVFDMISDKVVPKNGGQMSITINGVGPGGGADESGQMVTLVATSSDPSIIPNPTITGTGSTRTLTFTPVTDAEGDVIITVRAMDDGGTADGGDDTYEQTFMISVSPSNIPPSFDLGGDQVVDEDAGPQTVAGFATNINPGAPSEAGQVLTFLVDTDNPSLFSVAPTIDPITGDLTYTGAANANGTAMVTVQLMDDGGTDDGGIDTSDPQTFMIEILPVNDKPIANIAGPFTQFMNEGGMIRFDASGSSDLEQSSDSLTYLWDYDNDGMFDDAVGARPYFSAADLDGRTSALVRLQVIDDGGFYDGAKVFVVVENAAPFLQVTGDTNGVVGQMRRIMLNPIDPAGADQMAGFTYTINWGDGSPIRMVDGPAGATFGTAYKAAGTYDIHVTATDKDNGTSMVSVHTITIGTMEMQGDDFAISGTNGNDLFQLFKQNAPDQVEVFLNGNSQGIYTVPGRIQAFGLAGDDTFIGDVGGFDILWDGGVGNDVSYTHDGNDIIYGRSGNDVVIDYGGKNVVHAGDGHNVIRTNGGRDHIVTGNGNDDIRDAGGHNYIEAGNGNNVVYTGTGSDWVVTGTGNDVISSRGGNNRINAGDGVNTVVTSDGDDIIRGGNNIDVIVSYGGSNHIYAFAGNDKVSIFGSGNNHVHAGSGNDYVLAGLGNDILRGGTGNDILLGNNGNDILLGESGNDQLIGGLGQDILIGGLGQDNEYAENDGDILIGGSTSHDSNDAALRAILAEWTSAGSYNARVDNIVNGGGLNGSSILNRAMTVFDDGVRDQLFGGTEMDLFFGTGSDLLNDKTPGEVQF